MVMEINKYQPQKQYKAKLSLVGPSMTETREVNWEKKTDLLSDTGITKIG